MAKKGGKIEKNEEDSEDWCFDCKDGGDLIICDHENCVKSYHTACAEPDDSSQFICKLHKCYVCGKPSEIQCYGCPKGVCRRCIRMADFVHVRGTKGFCDYCVKLTCLVEEKKDVDSDGESIDLNNRDTYETLYKEYWEIINATEKLSLETLKSAKARLESGDNYDSENYDDDYQLSDGGGGKDGAESHGPGRKRKRAEVPKPTMTKGETKKSKRPNKKEFAGWGSKRLMAFLAAIGKDTTRVHSQQNLETIVKRYVKDKNLLRSKKTVECDVWLKSVFGRKTIKLNRIYDLLESHLAENHEAADGGGLGYDDSDDGDEHVELLTRKKREKEAAATAAEAPCFRFAAVVPKNIKLVYLRRTVVEKLVREPESFEEKVIGSFVRVKRHPNGCFPKRSYQLMQVSGVRKCVLGENDENVLLQALDMEISINTLSDDDFSEEECQELRNKAKSGVLEKLTLVGLEQKARSLHEDIVTDWIPRELTLLKHRIDQANEKGWRRELFDYLQRRQFLQDPSNRSKLLEKIPIVVPDTEDNDGSGKDDEKGNQDSEMSIPSGFRSNDVCSGSGDSLRPSAATDQAPQHANQESQELTGPGGEGRRHLKEKPPVGLTEAELEDTESSLWYITSSNGEKRGPVSLSVLKNWSYAHAVSEFRIYKASQTQETAVPLTAVIRRAFPEQ